MIDRIGRVVQLMGMGFPEDQVKAALTAAFFDEARATEYLLEGIPEGAGQQPPPQQQPAGGPGGPGGGDPLSALQVRSKALPFCCASTVFLSKTVPFRASVRSVCPALLQAHPQFAQLRAQLNSDPNSLPQVLQAFGAQNPAIAAAIQGNLPGFIELMRMDDDGGEQDDDDDDDDGGMVMDEQAMAGLAGMPGMPDMAQLGPALAAFGQMSDEQREQMLGQLGLTPEQLQQLAPMLAQMGGGDGMMDMGDDGDDGGAYRSPAREPGTGILCLTSIYASLLTRSPVCCCICILDFLST
eukprot:SAG22_NODE_52_length_24288_cov_15.594568_20_plen_297_part_00